MQSGWKTYSIDESARQNLVHLVRRQENIIRFATDRHLASLLACLGVQAELGEKFDRFSQAFGIDPSRLPANPWRSEIILFQNEIGIRLWIDGIEEFLPQEEGLAPFLNALSVDANGKLSQLFLFPGQIADNFLKKGVELVIVRDWILESGLVGDRAKALDYTKSNTVEMAQNIALTQARLMENCQLAFFGTHDLIDHVMGASRAGLCRSRELISNILNCYRQVFEPGGPSSNTNLIWSYLIAMVLDDLAQPRWYGSGDHEQLARKILDRLRVAKRARREASRLFVPETFNPIIDLMRARDPGFGAKVDKALEDLEREIQAA